MPSFYTQMQDVAKQLLGEFEQGTLSLDVYTPGGGTPYDPEPATYPPTRFDGVVRGVDAFEVADSLVHASDLVVTLPGDLNPKMQDKITKDGEQYNIVKIKAIPAAGVTVAWQVTIRK